jgi:hypothetical protein
VKVRLAIEIERFHDFARPNEIEALARATIINQVRQDVQATLPNHDVEVFGSERTGLAMATSDIDFRLLKKDQIGESALSGIPPEPKKRIQGLKALQNLQNNGFARHKLYPISMLRYARYPLISLQDRHSGLDLQVVLSNDTSLSRKFIQGYIEQYPYLRAVYFVVKTTFDIRGLSDVFRGGFGSYTLFMMLVASIQQKPHSRNDAAGCLINFLGFYHDFNTTLHGLSVNPPAVFDKADTAIMPGKVKSKLKVSTSPLLDTPCILSNHSTPTDRRNQAPTPLHALAPRPRRRNQRSGPQSPMYQARANHVRQTRCRPRARRTHEHARISSHRVRRALVLDLQRAPQEAEAVWQRCDGAEQDGPGGEGEDGEGAEECGRSGEEREGICGGGAGGAGRVRVDGAAVDWSDGDDVTAILLSLVRGETKISTHVYMYTQ